MQIGAAITSTTSSPPTVPPLWIWTCHHCHSIFPLGATRRCLYDGHYLCTGTTESARTGRIRRHKACGSIFDYRGWQEYGDWRRNETRRLHASFSTPHPAGSALRGTLDEAPAEDIKHLKMRNCFMDCNYPSECQWKTKVDQQWPLSQASDDRSISKEEQPRSSTERDKSSSLGSHQGDHLHGGSSPQDDSLNSGAEGGDTLAVVSLKALQDEGSDSYLLELASWPKPPRTSLGILAKSASLLRGLLQGSSTGYLRPETSRSVATTSSAPRLGLDLDPAQAALAVSSHDRTNTLKSSDETHSIAPSITRVWDWSIGGLNGFRQRDIGLSGEMLEEA